MNNEKNNILYSWALNLVKRIHQEMAVQEISPFNPYYMGKGILKTSIDFDRKVFNAARGDVKKITFFYEYYALFVEYGLGNGEAYDKSKMDHSFKSGTKYAYSKPGWRAPKPFLFHLVDQRVYSLARLIEHTLSENMTTFISNSLVAPEKKRRKSPQIQNADYGKDIKLGGDIVTQLMLTKR